MTMADVLPQIQQLQHADKLRLMQILLADIAHEEGVQLEIPASRKTRQPRATLGRQLRTMRAQALK